MVLKMSRSNRNHEIDMNWVVLFQCLPHKGRRRGRRMRGYFAGIGPVCLRASIAPRNSVAGMPYNNPVLQPRRRVRVRSRPA